MTPFQWIEGYGTRRRKARIGTAPFPEAGYRQRKAFLARLSACEDRDQPPDQVARFHFRLKEGSWTVTGTRANVERQLRREIAAYEAWRQRLREFEADEDRRSRLEQDRIERHRRKIEHRRRKEEQNRARLRQWGNTIGAVLAFLFDSLLVLIVVALVLCCVICLPVLLAIPFMLEDTFGRR